MSEDTDAKSPLVSRRKVVAGLGVAAATTLIHNEMGVTSEGISTLNGRFFPLYELHDTGINPEIIPPNLDLVFREAICPAELFTVEPLSILNSTGKVEEKVFRILPQPLLLRLAQEGTKVVFGDTSFNHPSNPSGIDIRADLIKTSAAIISTFLGAVLSLNQTANRRKFLKGAFFTGAAWLGRPFSSNLLSNLTINTQEHEAVQRIAARIQGLNMHLSPDVSDVFFRNALWAEKMLMMAETIKKDQQEKARIGYQVGLLHTGVEDFLQAGRPFCQFVLSHCPSQVLHQAIQNIGGLDNFCSMRILRLPPDLKAQDLENPETNSKIRSGIILDTELKDAILKMQPDLK